MIIYVQSFFNLNVTSSSSEFALSTDFLSGVDIGSSAENWIIDENFLYGIFSYLHCESTVKALRSVQ